MASTDIRGSSAKSMPSTLRSAKSVMEAESESGRATIKAVDMSEEMQLAAVDAASNALEKYNMEKDIAASIKKEFDRRYGATWHCVVGSNFGCFVTHESKHFIYFYLGASAILLFKTV